VGKAEKWRSPFLGEGWRCGVSEANTAKANFLKNIFVPFFPFFSNLSNYAKLSTLFNLIFSLPNRTALSRIAYNVGAASRRRGFHKGSGGRQTSKYA